MPETRSRASVEAEVADAHRREWGFVLAATVRVTGDIDLAEECVRYRRPSLARSLAYDRGPLTPGITHVNIYLWI